jgi:hypothetical protein
MESAVAEFKRSFIFLKGAIDLHRERLKEGETRA